MKTGIFVGSFNPPTNAHFDIAHYLYESNILEKIIFVPVNNSKKNLIELDKRIIMLDIYIKDYNYLEVSDIMKNYQANFNSCVLEELNKEYKDIYIIMGCDLLKRFSTFTNYQTMLEKYHFIIISRFDINCSEIIEKEYFNYYHKFVVLNYKSNLSSSLVRKIIKDKNDISKMVPKKIENYIIKERLYRED